MAQKQATSGSANHSITVKDLDEMVSLYGKEAVVGYIRCNIHLMYKQNTKGSQAQTYALLMSKLELLESSESELG